MPARREIIYRRGGCSALFFLCIQLQQSKETRPPISFNPCALPSIVSREGESPDQFATSVLSLVDYSRIAVCSVVTIITFMIPSVTLPQLHWPLIVLNDAETTMPMSLFDSDMVPLSLLMVGYSHVALWGKSFAHRGDRGSER